MCPLRQRDASPTWALYVLDPETTYVNVGFWSAVPLPHGRPDGYHNRRIEQTVTELGGRKSLYSTAFYDRGRVLGDCTAAATYDVLKKTYDPDGRLLDLYAKTVRARVTRRTRGSRLAEVARGGPGADRARCGFTRL